MPKFTMRIRVINKSGVPVSAHVGASLVGVEDWVEFYNKADDIKKIAQATRSFAKHSPAIKYVILKRSKSKSDTFVL